MTGYDEDIDSDEEEYFLESLNDNYVGRYVIDINYNRPLKNFPLTLNKIDEVDETSVKSPEVESEEVQDENGNEVRRVAWDPLQKVYPIESPKPRPKSASCLGEGGRSKKEKTESRPRSSCEGYPSRIPVKKQDQKGLKSDSDCSSNLSLGEGERWETCPRKKNKKKTKHKSLENLEYFGNGREEFVSFGRDYPQRPTSACCMRTKTHHEPKKHGPKRSNSQPNILRHQEPLVCSEVSRFRRSLRLLGLSSSDFGLPDSPKRSSTPPRPKSSYGATPTFTTRVLQRSYSLDCLREAVREASVDLYSGLPQRRVLAQAAYEEWYFKKTEETSKKMQEEREKKMEAQERLEEENRLRREKAEEQYQQWVQAKKVLNSKKGQKQTKVSSNLDSRLMKSKEEIDKAYLEWKKHKQQDLTKRKKNQLAEAEKAERESAQKEEKKKQAEKAFKEWKNKLEETIKLRREKERECRDRVKAQLTAHSKAGNSTTFQAWKLNKDKEITAKWRKDREAAQRAEDVRSMTVTERMYEAEQAFEEWLDKLDTRNQNVKKRAPPVTTAPWAPS